MEFRQFFELSDFVNRDVSGVSFDVTNVGFSRQFKVNDEDYEVELYHDFDSLASSEFARSLWNLNSSKEEIRQYLKNVYHVTLSGPRGYTTTNFNRGHTEVYSQLLMTLKRFSDERALEGLVFKSAEKKMSLVYDRFIRNFTDFVMVDTGNGTYLSQNLIDRIVDRYPAMMNVISRNKIGYDERLNKVKQDKLIVRRDSVIIKGMIGKAILLRKQHIGLVSGIYRDNILKVRYYHHIFGITDDVATPHEISLISSGLMPKYEEFLFNAGDRLQDIPGDHKPYVGVLPGGVDEF